MTDDVVFSVAEESFGYREGEFVLNEEAASGPWMGRDPELYPSQRESRARSHQVVR